VEAGTRNSIDVLNALQQLSATRLELAQARTAYALGWLKLKAAAGMLGEQDVHEVNGWLAPAVVLADTAR
jgi:outer membrane protein TolC